MKIVVPQRIAIVTILLRRPHDPSVLRFILRTDDDRAAPRGAARFAGDAGDDVFGRRVENLLRRIEPQAVEMKLVDPVGGVRYEELTNSLRGGSVEINWLPPFV